MILIYIIGFILGLFIFALLNSIFDIIYFGFKAIGATFMGCWFAGVIIVLLFGAVVKWIIIILIILWIISKIFKGNNSK